MQRGRPEGLPPFRPSSLDVEAGWTSLAKALVVRLQGVAPNGITVAAGPNSVDLVNGSVRWASQFLKLNTNDDIQDPASLERACIGVLDRFQDWAAEETGDPWPAREGEMPRPGVEVKDQLILPWYGDQGSPALALEPIRREDLR